MSLSRQTIAILTLCVFLFSEQANALTLGQAAQVAQTAQPAAFNTVEMVAYNVEDRVPQWQSVKAALKQDVKALKACLKDESNCTGTAMTSWRELVKGLKNSDDMTKMNFVNAFFNRWQYRTDIETYNVSEHWAGPIAFMQNSGDCEDYAIAKYVTLKFLGFKDNAMRIMAVIDNNRGGIGHSVLSVESDEGKMVLDNTASRVYSDGQQTGYAPRFAVNQSGIYTYAQQPQIVMANYSYMQ